MKIEIEDKDAMLLCLYIVNTSRRRKEEIEFWRTRKDMKNAEKNEKNCIDTDEALERIKERLEDEIFGSIQK